MRGGKNPQLIMVESPFMTRVGDAPGHRELRRRLDRAAGTGPVAQSRDADSKTADECLYRSKQAGRNRTTGSRDSAAVPLARAADWRRGRGGDPAVAAAALSPPCAAAR